MQGWKFVSHTAVWPCVAHAPPPPSWCLVLVVPTRMGVSLGAPCFHAKLQIFGLFLPFLLDAAVLFIVWNQLKQAPYSGCGELKRGGGKKGFRPRCDAGGGAACEQIICPFCIYKDKYGIIVYQPPYSDVCTVMFGAPRNCTFLGCFEAMLGAYKGRVHVIVPFFF